MADFNSLDGLDPYDLQDSECERAIGWFGSLDEGGWSLVSACQGWSRRDVLAHLVAAEEYFAACLDGTVADLMERYTELGMTTVDEFGLLGVAASEGKTGPELLAMWTAANARNRAGFRRADGTDIDSSIGAYPARLQAFHVAFEYGIHANDVDAPIDPAQHDDRQHWLAAVGQFASTETNNQLQVQVEGERFTVTAGSESYDLNRDEFIAGVAARPASMSLEPKIAALLDPGY